jgi:L-malate glycosyltransferase
MPAPGPGVPHPPDDRKRLVIVDSSVAVTGGLRMAARMARSLAPWASTTIVLPKHARIPPAELADFADVVFLPIRQIRRSVRDLALFLPALLYAGWRLRRLLAGSSPSTLIINDFNQLQGVTARLLGFGGRLVTFVRCDPDKFPPRLADAWLRAAYRASDQVVPISDFVAGRLTPNPKLRTVHDVINLDLPRWPREERGPGGRDVVQIANYITDKGHVHVLDAFLRIAAKHPDSRLIFYGGDMGLRKNQLFKADLKRRAAATAFAERIFFRGFAEDIAEALSSAAVVCNLSKSEALSCTCIEAAQLGLPVVAFRSGGPEEVIIDGVTGYLCDIGDVDCAAARIDALLSDPGKASKMGSAAAEHVNKVFGPDRFIVELRDVLAI